MVTKKMNSLDEKFKKDELKFELITNENLICKNCRKKYDDTNIPCNTSKCDAFTIKPDEVLDGGDCIEYEPQR